jgi:phosphoglycolate phosphatase
MVDTAPDFQVAANQVRAEYALAPWPLARVAACIGKGPDNLVHQLLAADLGADALARHYPQALASYHRHYHAVNGQLAEVYPGVRAGLAKLRAGGLRLACVTNKPIAFALPLLEISGLLPAFEVVYGGDSLPRKKPDPMPLLQVCADFSLAPHKVVAIGDSSNDAEAARAAGCRVLNVPYGYNHGQSIHDVDSDGIVDTLLDAARLLSAANPYQHVSQ